MWVATITARRNKFFRESWLKLNVSFEMISVEICFGNMLNLRNKSFDLLVVSGRPGSQSVVVLRAIQPVSLLSPLEDVECYPQLRDTLRFCTGTSELCPSSPLQLCSPANTKNIINYFWFVIGILFCIKLTTKAIKITVKTFILH